ncbi:50S ribosome-binding GTPase, partial [Rickettsiales bacterium]|nr:50S ribosome-binding GTPase [Rickettsiales bacterium]
MVCDLSEPDSEVVLLRGGDGGAGNSVMKTSTNQAPRNAKNGKDGEESIFVFLLMTMSDVGLVGLPNVGKSSLLSAVSEAKSKVGNYHFTTIKPQVGFVEVRNYDGFT